MVEPAGPRRRRATLIGGSAILMWATLALFTAMSGGVPPFQLLAMCFSIASGLAILVWVIRKQNPLQHLKLPIQVWLLGVGGLFGYHAAYFIALRGAPVVEASLIAYLWPLLIVLFSALLPGESLRQHHFIGAIMGFAGAAILVTGGGQIGFDSRHLSGYLAASACALIWSSYSVLSRRVGHIPTTAVGGFCLLAALFAIPAHFMLEVTVWPHNGLQWLAILALGLGPVGGAFFTWDIGVKHGDIQVLGALAYAAPLLSTVILVLTGWTAPSWSLAIACLLIVGGGLFAARDLLRAEHR